MFNHSIKVPRLYKAAGKIIQEVVEGGGSLKQLVFEKKHFNVNALYALVTLALKKNNDLDFLLKRTQLLVKEPRFNPWLVRILICELLWGKKALPKNDCKPIQTILGYEQMFKAHLSDTSETCERPSAPAVKRKPRYVRINTVLMSYEEALSCFKDEGWILMESNKDYTKFLEQVGELIGDYFMEDIHVQNLLLFPSGTKFFNHPGYKNGWIILQDKASCLPVHILNPPPESIVLDMCAAPGMKTSQLAAVLNNKGTVYAVERDERRYQSLLKILESSGATCVKPINNDILQCKSDDFPGVNYILVDPSCSGSGMADRLEYYEEQSILRLEKLSGFQIKILRGALTKYPSAQRVVYSTCSIYPEENEDVVKQVLETNYNFKLINARKIISKNWLNFGSSSFGKIGKYCLYARPEQDFTNGFFVAVFERIKEGEENEFFDNKIFNKKKKEQMHKKFKEAMKENKMRIVNIKEEENENVSDNTVSMPLHEEEQNYSVEKTENGSEINDKSKNKKHNKKSGVLELPKTKEQSESALEVNFKPKNKKRKKEVNEIDYSEASNYVSEIEVVQPKKKKNKNTEKNRIADTESLKLTENIATDDCEEVCLKSDKKKIKREISDNEDSVPKNKKKNKTIDAFVNTGECFEKMQSTEIVTSGKSKPKHSKREHVNKEDSKSITDECLISNEIIIQKPKHKKSKQQ